ARFYAKPQATAALWFADDSNVPLDLAGFGFAIVGIGLLAARGRSLANLRAAMPLVAFLLTAGLCFAWGLSDRMVLQENVFAPWLYPTTFLAIGTALGIARPLRSALEAGIALGLVMVAAIWAATRHEAAHNGTLFALAGLATLALAVSRWR